MSVRFLKFPSVHCFIKNNLLSRKLYWTRRFKMQNAEGLSSNKCVSLSPSTLPKSNIPEQVLVVPAHPQKLPLHICWLFVGKFFPLLCCQSTLTRRISDGISSLREPLVLVDCFMLGSKFPQLPKCLYFILSSCT